MNEVKEKKKIGLTTRIFIALIAGAIVGIALNMFAADVDFVQNVLVNGIFYVVGQGFIRLMQMLVVPLVFCSLICGATAIGDSKTLGKVGVKIIGFYIFTTMMAVAVALGIGLLIKPETKTTLRYGAATAETIPVCFPFRICAEKTQA